MFFIQYEHIKAIQYNIGDFSTDPKFATTDNNVAVVIKTFNGPEGNRVLFNELVCYKLAQLLDIPMPNSGICLIDDDTIIYNNIITADQLGYGFYSTYLNKVATSINSLVIPFMKNTTVFYKVLLFDHIIFNTDRNPGNLLVQYYKNNVRLQVIDHTHVFVNQSIWDANCLKRAIDEKDYYSTKVLDYNKPLYDMFFRNLSITEEHFREIKDIIYKKYTKKTLQTIINEVPTEWKPTENDCRQLVEYILYRVRHLDDICSTIYRYLRK